MSEASAWYLIATAEGVLQGGTDETKITRSTPLLSPPACAPGEDGGRVMRRPYVRGHCYFWHVNKKYF
jgi:hypothetical protein